MQLSLYIGCFGESLTQNIEAGIKYINEFRFLWNDALQYSAVICKHRSVRSHYFAKQFYNFSGDTKDQPLKYSNRIPLLKQVFLISTN